MKKLGIIQSRGLGDIVIALPIAHYYHKQNYKIYWPVCEQWVEQLSSVAAYINWLPVKPDTGAFFYDVPYQLLKKIKCDEILPLYQALTGRPEFTQEPYFQHTSFDRYKYVKAGVPFTEKWKLSECITRSKSREEDLFNLVVGTDTTPYIVTHLSSSEQTVKYDPSIIPEGWRVIPITDKGYIFDWLTIIEKAEAVIMTDSCMANLVDQLQIPIEKYFIPQHHIQLTPVHGCDWYWLANPDLKKSAIVFQAG